jgi:hypothetical protein
MFRRAAYLGVVALVACQSAAPDPTFVTQWDSVSQSASRSALADEPVAARTSAYVAIAQYEGYAADPRANLRSLAGQLNGLWSVPVVDVGKPVDGATVAAEAARVVLDSLFATAPATRAAIDSLASAHVRARRRARVRDVVSARSVEHGRAIGRAIVAWASGDGFLATRTRAWRPTASDSRWTASAGAKPIEPHWGALRTFVIRNGDECAPPTPSAYSIRPNSDFWKMGKELYDSARAPSDDQRTVAQFWADTSAAAASGSRWLGVLRQATTQRRVPADRAIEAQLLATVAIADAFVGTSREQYRSLVVRPVSYVNRVFDRRWTPTLTPPQSPAWPSGPAAVAGAAAAVLSHFFGDNTAFTDSTQVARGAGVRAYRSFSHAAEEAGAVRATGGVDYPAAVSAGKAQGECTGQLVAGRLKTR